MSFVRSKRFRQAWMTSLIAGVAFPFISAMMGQDTDMSYLARVNDDFLQKTLSFAAVFFAIQCVWAFVLYRRDQISAQDKTS